MKNEHELLTVANLTEFKRQLESMKLQVNKLIAKKNELIDYNGYTDKEINKRICKINPEDYYCLKLFDKAVAIVYTTYSLDEKTGQWYRGKDYHYSIRYYKCRSEIFKDGRLKLPYCLDNTSYGVFDNFDEAISMFKKACIDLLNQCGFSYLIY